MSLFEELKEISRKNFDRLDRDNYMNLISKLKSRATEGRFYLDIKSEYLTVSCLQLLNREKFKVFQLDEEANVVDLSPDKVMRIHWGYDKDA